MAQAAHGIGIYRRERCGCHKRARTFSHLSITVLQLLLARHVHVRRHSMHNLRLLKHLLLTFGRLLIEGTFGHLSSPSHIVNLLLMTTSRAAS